MDRFANDNLTYNLAPTTMVGERVPVDVWVRGVRVTPVET